MLISEIISCFLIKEFNVQKAHYYLTIEKNLVVSKNVISKIYKTFCEYCKDGYYFMVDTKNESKILYDKQCFKGR